MPSESVKFGLFGKQLTTELLTVHLDSGCVHHTRTLLPTETALAAIFGSSSNSKGNNNNNSKVDGTN